MALELIGGAAVGAVFGELARACMEMKDKAVMFRPTMNQLKDTLESLEPVIKDIELYNHQLNRPESEIKSLIRLMERGKRLLCKCSSIRRWYDVRKVRHQAKLVELDKSLQRFLNVNLQAQIARDQKQMLLLFRSTILGPDHRGHQDLTVGMTVSQIGHAKGGLMTFELVVAAAFGDVFEELVRACMEVKDVGVMFRSGMDQLKSTLNSSVPVIKDIELYNHELNQPKSEIECLVRLTINGKKFVCRCSIIPKWDCMKKIIDYKKQEQLNKSSVMISIKNVKSSNHELNRLQSNEFCCSGSTLNPAKDLSGNRPRPNVEPDCKIFVKSIMPTFSISEDKYTALRYQNPNISSHSGRTITAPRISEYDETEGRALPPPAVRYQNPNSRMITASRNAQQYQRFIMPSSSDSDQNSLRILEYDQTNENPLSEGGNRRHIERLAYPPPAADEISAGELENHEKEYEKMITHSRAPVQLQPLQMLEDTASSSRQKLITEIPYSGISETGFSNILCYCGTRAAMRILEYDRNRDRLYYCCERRNCSFFEWWVPPAAAAGELGSSDEFKKMMTQGELGTTSRHQKLLTPAIVLLSCFNLVLSFVILMYLYKGEGGDNAV